jgi:hypothetical protein
MEHEATAKDSPNRQGLSIFIDTILLIDLETGRAEGGENRGSTRAPRLADYDACSEDV